MTSETYLDHPNFGLLFRVCLVEGNQELFTTLYAQRLFFVVTTAPDEAFEFEPIGRTDARIKVENRLRLLRRNRQINDYTQLQAIHKRTFQ